MTPVRSLRRRVVATSSPGLPGICTWLLLWLLLWLLVGPEELMARARPAARYPSVEVYRGEIRVRARPSNAAPIRGYIFKSGRFPVLEKRQKGNGCKYTWYRIGPEAWACSGWLLPRRAPPTALRRLQVSWGPGPFFGARMGRHVRLSFYRNVAAWARGRALRLRGTVGFEVHSRILLGGRPFLVTRSGGLVDAARVRRLGPSTLVGISVRSPRDLPMAIAIGPAKLLKVSGGRLIPTGATLERYGVRRVKRILTVAGKRVALLRGGKAVLRHRVALARRPSQSPPVGVGTAETWADVDLTERLVYAMRGKRVVRVMLSSMGVKTPPGLYRVEQKLVWKDMSQRYGPDPFFLESVPYVVFFKGDFGLHGTYWHDGFGSQLSHGCPNLSLADARFLFDWLGPALPPGFVSIRPTKLDPGAVVRVRGRYVFRPGEVRPGRPARSRRRPSAGLRR